MGCSVMKTINFQDINLSSMQLSKIQGTKSSVYIDKDKCYKILDGLYISEKIPHILQGIYYVSFAY